MLLYNAYGQGDYTLLGCLYIIKSLYNHPLPKSNGTGSAASNLLFQWLFCLFLVFATCQPILIIAPLKFLVSACINCYTSQLSDRRLANETVDERIQTVYQTKLTILLSEDMPVCRKCPQPSL